MADDQQGRILRPQPFAQGTGYGARHDQPDQAREQPKQRAQREAAPEAQGDRRGEPEGARHQTQDFFGDLTVIDESFVSLDSVSKHFGGVRAVQDAVVPLWPE